MDKTSHEQRSKYQENILTAVSAGSILILLGIIFAFTPNLYDATLKFFQDFNFITVFETESNFVLPGPLSPWNHTAVYQAVLQLTIGLGVLQIVLLTLGMILRSPINKTAETISNLIFWFGSSYLVNNFLNSSITNRLWFAFWIEIMILVGFSFIARAIVLSYRR